MQVLNVTNLPIYLVYDKAPVPFGDVFDDTTATGASPAVFTTVGYTPVANDLVALSQDVGGSLDAAFMVGTKYYVVNPSGDTYQLSATKGGSAINSTNPSTGIATHLLSNQVDGTTLPFKPGSYAVCLNMSGGTLVLDGAPDSAAPTPGNYIPPKGPGSFTTIASLTAGSAALVGPLTDWIRVHTSGTLVLLQN